MEVNKVKQAPIEDNRIIVTESAINKIGRIIKQEGIGALLRIAVSAGGCKEFQYEFSIQNNCDYDNNKCHYIDATRNIEQLLKTEESSDETEFIWRNKDVSLIIIDKLSIDFMSEGAVVDYEDSLTRSGFMIHNPQYTSSCGCGNSFYAK